MTVYSGKFGNVHYLIHDDPANPDLSPTNYTKTAVSNWQVTETVTPFEYANSATRAGRGRADGIYDYSGSFQSFGDTPPLMPGQYFNFEGFTHPTDFHTDGTGIVLKSTQYNSAGHPLHLRLGSIVESVTIEWDFSDGSLVRHTTNFAQANAIALTEVAEKQIDGTEFIHNSICGASLRGVLIDPTAALADIPIASSITEIPNVLSASLTINSNNQTRVNSSTNCQTAREPGIVDAEFSFVEQSHIRPFALGDQVHLRIEHNDGDDWNLRGMKYVGRNDFRVDIDTGEIIQQTNNFALKALIEGTNTGVPETALGYLARPGEDSIGGAGPTLPWWPNQYISNAFV